MIFFFIIKLLSHILAIREQRKNHCNWQASNNFPNDYVYKNVLGSSGMEGLG